VVREAGRDRITMIAASLAFHGFLALLPIMIATVGLLGLVGLSSATLHHLVHATSVLFPRQMSGILNEQLIRPPSRQVNVTELVLGLLVALWSAVEAMAALQIALDVAYEVPRDRGFLGRRAAALPLVGVTVLLGGAASVLLVLGGPLGRLVPDGLGPVLGLLRYAGSLLLLVLLLSAYFSFGPARDHIEWEWVSPGGVLATVGWLGSALAFSFYLDHFAHDSRTYGALAGVAVTLLWMFLTAVLVLLGAELNRELERIAQAGSGPTPVP
jgi:membrane protein